MSAEEASNLALFEGKSIRKAKHQDEWWLLLLTSSLR